MANYYYSKYNVITNGYNEPPFIFSQSGLITSHDSLSRDGFLWSSYASSVYQEWPEAVWLSFRGTGTNVRSGWAVGQSYYSTAYLSGSSSGFAIAQITFRGSNPNGSGYIIDINRTNTTQGSDNSPVSIPKKKSIGGLVQSNIVANDGTYPSNGAHSDGYWYVRGSAVYVPPTNAAPTMSLTTTDNRTLYESDTFGIVGSATDVNSGNVVSVKYQVNEGTIRAISTGISTGAAIPFSKSLTYKAGVFHEGSTVVSAALAENANHTLKVWAEDDQGGKSAVQTRTFKVVANRPPTITFNPFSAPTGLINTDNITVSGSVSDPDGNTVSVKFKIGNGSYTDVYSGAGGTFSFDVNLALLADGPNAITVQAVDSYGALTQKALNIAKSLNAQLLKTSVTRYKLTPPNASAKGVLLWVERDAVDVSVTAEISMTAAGETELFVPMTKSVTAYVGVGIEEDEFTYEAAAPKENIVIKLTQTRTNTATNNGITLISGVLS